MVSVYVPAGVPFEFASPPDPAELPPHERRSKAANTGQAKTNFLLLRKGRRIRPAKRGAHKQEKRMLEDGMIAAEGRAVVVTVAVSIEVAVLLIIRLAGVTEQNAPGGAPPQTMVVCPLKFAPPIVSAYWAV